MNIRRSALFLGTAAGAVLGAAVVTGPIAHADEPALPVSIDELETLWPGMGSGHETSSQTTSSLLGLYRTSQATFDVTTYEDNWSNPVGDYEFSLESQNFSALLFNYHVSTQEVTDSSGAGPLVGTTLDSSYLGIPIPDPFGPLRPFLSLHLSIPNGMNADLFEYTLPFLPAFGNEFVTGPDGTTDVVFFGDDVIPLFDIPA